MQFSQEPFRQEPQLPAHAVKTYHIVSPLATHTRSATCAEVGCGAYAHGWRTTVPADSPQAYYIEHDSGRAFTADRSVPGSVTFTFEAGQSCFAADTHRVPLDRPEIYLVRDGDWRGNPLGTGPRRHTRPEFWVEDFAEHQQAIADEIEKG